MKVLGQYVLIEQTMIKKKGVISLDALEDRKDQFDFYYKVLQLGSKCEGEVLIGDFPIFSEHVRFSGVKLILKNSNKMIAHIIVHEGDIIGTDNELSICDEIKENKN